MNDKAKRTPPTPVPAATILMLRDGKAGLETFMVVRHHQIDFASGALVFPGGKVEEADFTVQDLCDGAPESDPATTGMMVGAIREAFEESGILLARPQGGQTLVPGPRLKQLDAYREPLNKGELGIRDFLQKESLRLACDQLVPFAHWITPEMMPKRFDTRFYLARAPEDHLALHDGQESVDSLWLSPQAALEGAKKGTYTIIFPTRVNIELLAQSPTTEGALADAAARKITTVLPWTENRPDGPYLCIPAEAGYAVTEEKLPQRPPA